MSYVRIGALSLALATIVGCSTPAPLYQPSIDNVLTLKRAKVSDVKLGQFSATDGQGGKVWLRAAAMTSPYNDNYAEYLREALRQELAEAGRLSDTASIEISGVLIKNYVSAGDIKVGDAVLTARFVVKNGDRIGYTRDVTATHQWESSFVGAFAISTARDNYRFVVQKLLKQLYADPDFIAALK